MLIRSSLQKTGEQKESSAKHGKHHAGSAQALAALRQADKERLEAAKKAEDKAKAGDRAGEQKGADKSKAVAKQAGTLNVISISVRLIRYFLFDVCFVATPAKPGPGFCKVMSWSRVCCDSVD